MPRTPLLPLLLILGGLALSSCGKGGATTVTVQAAGAQAGGSSTSPGRSAGGSGGGSQGGTPTPTPPASKSPSQKRALAFASAVNLTADDVPGFTPKSSRESSSAREKKLGRELAKCAGAIGLGAGEENNLPGEGKSVASQASKDFELKHGIIDFTVSSQVSVQPSAADARKGLQAIRSAHLRKCFSHYVQLLFAGEHVKGATAGPVSIQAGIPPAPDTAGGFGWRITASFIVRGVKVPIYLDFLGFVDGPSEVTLLSSGLIRPFPAEVQQHLFALLLARAKGHAL
ncbi:MAG: hypothetical protein ACHQHO_07365 [Solirubrobacterales bacterium]